MDKVCVYPDGRWCYLEDIERVMSEYGLSDDYSQFRIEPGMLPEDMYLGQNRKVLSLFFFTLFNLLKG